MTTAIDLEAYFQRIGYSSEPRVDLDALQAIHDRHPQAVPFENLNPLLKRRVRLDLESLAQELIVDRRGGYCFEHNLLRSHVLGQLGFRVSGLAAQVLWNRPEGAITPRGHVLLPIDM